ncbi:MAG: hypothetical protein LBH14_03635 [Desulfobulbaceae bacterium]|jgi:hypothetical protein|nr:hypothetical protein [Desulfobulbaceae bacterium]
MIEEKLTDEEIELLAGGIDENEPANLTEAQADMLFIACDQYTRRYYDWKNRKAKAEVCLVKASMIADGIKPAEKKEVV